MKGCFESAFLKLTIMIKNFKNLNNDEVELLLKAPALFSVFAASNDHEISNAQKSDAIKLAHLKSFTSDDLTLISYYSEVEKKFKTYFESIVKIYTPFDDEKREELEIEIEKVNFVISKLDTDFANALHRSLCNYAEHVKKSDKSILENFIFPIPINGISRY